MILLGLLFLDFDDYSISISQVEIKERSTPPITELLPSVLHTCNFQHFKNY